MAYRKTNGGVMQSELRLQQECYLWFHNNYPSLRGLFFKIKNEGHNRITGAIDKATGLVPGVADMCFLRPANEGGGVFFIEFKTEIGRQSSNQKKWESKVKEAGYYYIIIRHEQDFRMLFYRLLE